MLRGTHADPLIAPTLLMTPTYRSQTCRYAPVLLTYREIRCRYENYNAARVRLLYGSSELNSANGTACKMYTISTSSTLTVTQITGARLYRPLFTVSGFSRLSRGETRDKFSIYVLRNDSNQSPTHLGGFSQLRLKRPPARSRNALASASDSDRFESFN